jgi:MoxR-like ATPase
MSLASRFGIKPETEIERLTRLVAEAEANVRRASDERDRNTVAACAGSLRELQNAVIRAEMSRDAAVRRLQKVGGK